MLLDTSGLLIYLDRSERRHSLAANLFQTSANKIVHNYVLAELVALGQARGLPRKQVLDFVLELSRNPKIELVWVESARHDAALALLRDQADKTYSLTDAVSIVLMQERQIQRAFTSDRHFKQAGFEALLCEAVGKG